MRPLLRPAGKPHPDLLKNALGLSGVSGVLTSGEFEAAIESILAILKGLTGADTVSLEDRQDQGNASRRGYALCAAAMNTASLQFSRGHDGRFTMKATMLWPSLPRSIEKVIAGLDTIWWRSTWLVLYAYDSDDFSLQNCTMSLGLENWGLVRDQLDFATRYGVEVIDAKANPGYMLNQDGLFWSIQWLNYWNDEAQRRMLTQPVADLPAGVIAEHFGQGALRIKLGEWPGRLDDVAFHQLQLECRKSLRFRSPFAVEQ
jgi:hypothetical protein